MLTEILKKAAGTVLALTLIATAATAAPQQGLRAYAAEEYTTWSQLDERWSGVDMNGTTVGRSGCLITSLSIMAMHSDSIDDKALENLGISDISEFNPGVLANAYSSRGAFNYYGGIASWGTISQIIPSITFVRDSNLKSTDKEGIAAEIKEMLDSGLHIILNVNGHHWVYIEGVYEGEIFMFDPASSERIVTDYYTLTGGNEYWALRGKNPPKSVDTEGLSGEKALDPQEYICSGNTEVYSDSGASEKLFTLPEGTVVTVDAECDELFRLSDGYGGVLGWTYSGSLMNAGEEPELGAGDINGDGIVDEYDLALLNEHLSAADELPDGASKLRGCEAAAGDINGDGVTDKLDVVAYLGIICK